VAEELRAAGYTVRTEPFDFPFFEELSPPVLVLGGDMPVPSAELRTLRNSGAGELTGPVRAVDLGLVGRTPSGPSTSACEPQDFEGFTPGAVALARRGTCPFQIKANLAAAAGASALVIVNEGVEGRAGVFEGRLSEPSAIPVLAVSLEVGLRLRDASAPVRLEVRTRAGRRATHNVIAERSGQEQGSQPWVVVGAHLDSVDEGPGLNDNGSGTAAVLEAALALARSPVPSSVRLRFAFWGAEELGLIGSRHHVEQLREEERRGIALYINLDMVGSPNFVRFVTGAPSQTAGDPGQSLQERVSECLCKRSCGSHS